MDGIKKDLKELVDETLAKALLQNSPALARSIDVLVANGKGWREINAILKKSERLFPTTKHDNLFAAIWAYSRIAINKRKKNK